MSLTVGSTWETSNCFSIMRLNWLIPPLLQLVFSEVKVRLGEIGNGSEIGVRLRERKSVGVVP